MLSLEDGKELVKLVRETIEIYVREGREIETPVDIPSSFLEKRGVFVTISTYPEHELRGCIGLPYPERELVRAVIGSAISAAVEDPRFAEITEEEFDKIVVEVSVLTVPKRIYVKDPRDYIKNIETGKDGLIIKYGVYGGLLLPQVPIELGWDTEEFLDNLCIKAGLSPDIWMTEKVEIYKFQAQIFSEEKPKGEINERKMGD